MNDTQKKELTKSGCCKQCDPTSLKEKCFNHNCPCHILMPTTTQDNKTEKIRRLKQVGKDYKHAIKKLGQT